MAKQISLSTYTIKIKVNNVYQNLSKLPGKIKFVDILENYLKLRQSNHILNDISETLMKVETINKKNNSLSGLLNKGEYGYQTQIVGIDNFLPMFQKTMRQADVMPFYYLFSIPEDETTGFAAFQMFGIQGIKGIFQKDFKEFIQENYPEWKIQIQPIFPHWMIEEYLENSELKNISFTLKELPSDIADNVTEDLENEIFEFEYKLKPKRGESFSNKIMNIFIKLANNEETASNEFLELIPFSDKEFSKAQIKVKIGDKYKKINIFDLESMLPRLDVTDDIKLSQSSGLPTFDSINPLAKSILLKIAQNTLSRDYETI